MIEINPQDAKAYYNRGVAAQVKGDSDRAITDYTKAVEISPSFVDAYVGRGIVDPVRVIALLSRILARPSRSIRGNPMPISTAATPSRPTVITTGRSRITPR